jgi:hypothetical protein
METSLEKSAPVRSFGTRGFALSGELTGVEIHAFPDPAVMGGTSRPQPNHHLSLFPRRSFPPPSPRSIAAPPITAASGLILASPAGVVREVENLESRFFGHSLGAAALSNPAHRGDLCGDSASSVARSGRAGGTMRGGQFKTDNLPEAA